VVILVKKACESCHCSVDVGMYVGDGKTWILAHLGHYERVMNFLFTIVAVEKLDRVSTGVVVVTCEVRDKRESCGSSEQGQYQTSDH
jgi:hypothetical protein